MKSKRAITIAESERTAIIFGMPEVAIRAGVGITSFHYRRLEKR